MPIYFFSENIHFALTEKKKHTNWLLQVADHYGQKVEVINYVFVSDDYLLDLNRERLGHDYYTDILTFQLNDKGKGILADIYISVERVKENNRYEFGTELRRVMVHGLLHCLGYADISEEEQIAMRALENKALSMFHVEHTRE